VGVYARPGTFSAIIYNATILLWCCFAVVHIRSATYVQQAVHLTAGVYARPDMCSNSNHVTPFRAVFVY
jgi:hypothetical protein